MKAGAQTSLNKRQRTLKGQQKTDNPEKLATQDTQDDDKQNINNPEKLATQDTQDDDKQNINTSQYVLDTTIRKQTQIM